MKFIKLTESNGTISNYHNIDNILTFADAYKSGSNIWLKNSIWDRNLIISVKESPEEILKLIKETQ